MSETKPKEKSNRLSAFMSYGVPLIALGVFVLIEEIGYQVLFGWSIEYMMLALAAALVPGAFVFKMKEKKTLSIVFAILSTAIAVFLSIPYWGRSYGLDLVQIIAYLFLHVLLVLFVTLREMPIKSFFPLFPVVICLVILFFDSPYKISMYGLCSYDTLYGLCSYDTLLLYILGFSMTTPTATKASKPVKKNAGVALEKLESLAKLKEQGILTNEEFETKKAEIMQIM